jgi:uncharacterized protein (DUF362 family)
MAPDHHLPVFSRRRFFVRLLRACGVASLAGLGGLALYDDRKTPSLSTPTDTRQLPGFNMPDDPHRMCIVRGTERAASLEAGLKALGGMETFIKPGDRVLIKVNAAFASPPILGATSHPDLVAALVHSCRQAGAALVRVTDNSINDPASSFELTGIGPAARSAGAEVVLPHSHYFYPVTVSNARLLRQWPVLFTPLSGVNKLIGTAPVKDHHRSGASLTMKNWYGLLGGRRNVFHQQIHQIIYELAQMVQPTLVVLDGIQSMISNGPTGGSLGDLKPTETLIISTDQVAADAYGATLLGKQPLDLAHIGMAAAQGLGHADYQTLQPIEINTVG